MSPSIRPTCEPRRARPTARLAATVLLPTPPLPAPTAITFFTCGSTSRFGPPCPPDPAGPPCWPRVLADQSMCTPLAPTSRSARSTSRWMTSFIGQAGVVSSMFTETSSPSIRTPLTMFKVTMSLNSSGSFTRPRAAITASRCTGIKIPSEKSRSITARDDASYRPRLSAVGTVLHFGATGRGTPRPVLPCKIGSTGLRVRRPVAPKVTYDGADQPHGANCAGKTHVRDCEFDRYDSAMDLALPRQAQAGELPRHEPVTVPGGGTRGHPED